MTIPRLMVAAASSGGGKTTLCLGLLAALRRRGLSPVPFKCGPDYIDTQFHRLAADTDPYNLDLFFTPEQTLRQLFVRGSQGHGIALIEGVMGLFDGMGCSSTGSPYAIARALQTPIILSLDARTASHTLCALVHGLATYQPDGLVAGCVLSRCAPERAARLGQEIERATGVRYLGCLPKDAQVELPQRHLGLTEPGDVKGAGSTVERLADLLVSHVDLDAVLELAAAVPELDCPAYVTPALEYGHGPGPRIAVAHDRAFSFYYTENLEMLQDLGACLQFFSPLQDACLPDGADGLYIGGGYPELHAAELAANDALRAQIKEALAQGMPCVAECGGFMYLQEQLHDQQDLPHPMVGALQGVSRSTGRLSHFGYIRLKLEQDCVYGPAGVSVPAHEFHYWHSDHGGSAALAQKAADPASTWPAVVASPSLYAGYPHIYWPSNPDLARHFVQAACDFGRTRT